MTSEAPRDRRQDVYRADPVEGERGYPIGPIGVHDSGPYVPCAIGFCPRCGTNSRRTCSVRGLFNCTACRYYWYDERVGEQQWSIEDYFTG